MNVSINWLKEYIDFDLSPKALADRLLMLGVETESIKQLGEGLEGVVVGRINTVRNHPNANKLVLCDVDVEQGTDLQIVCGAPNAREGMAAPVALVGAELATGLSIKPAKIRGEESHGMLCSEKELGIGDDASGLMALSDDLPIGAPLAQALGLGRRCFGTGNHAEPTGLSQHDRHRKRDRSRDWQSCKTTVSPRERGHRKCPRTNERGHQCSGVVSPLRGTGYSRRQDCTVTEMVAADT